MTMNKLCQHLFATATFSRQHHGGIGYRNFLCERQQGQHPWIFGHNFRFILITHRQYITFDVRQQVMRIKRFEQIIARTSAHCRHSFVHFSIRCHQHDRNPWIASSDSLQQCITIHGAHVHITDHQPHCLVAQQINRLLATAGSKRNIAFQFERCAQRFKQCRIIFHNQYR